MLIVSLGTSFESRLAGAADQLTMTTRINSRAFPELPDFPGNTQGVSLSASILVDRRPGTNTYAGRGTLDVTSWDLSPSFTWTFPQGDFVCTLVASRTAPVTLDVVIQLDTSVRNAPTVRTATLTASGDPTLGADYLCTAAGRSFPLTVPSLTSWTLQSAYSTGTPARGPFSMAFTDFVPSSPGAFRYQGQHDFDYTQPNAIHESSTLIIQHQGPIVRQVTSELTQYFLRGVSAVNRVRAIAEFGDSAADRQIIFSLNGTERATPAAGGDVTTVYDVGTDFQLGENTIEVRATQAGESSRPLALSPLLIQHLVPPWAPSNFTAARTPPFVRYEGRLNWPPNAFDASFPIDVLVLGGRYGLGPAPGGDPLLVLHPRSNAVADTGPVSGFLSLDLGPLYHDILPLGGQTTSTLDDTGLHLRGTMNAALALPEIRRPLDLSGLLSVVNLDCSQPGLATAAVCTIVGGLTGPEIRARANIRLSGSYADDGNAIAWQPDFQGRLDVNIALEYVIGRPLDLFAVAGGVRGCATFQANPSFSIRDSGGSIQFYVRYRNRYLIGPTNTPIGGGGACNTLASGAGQARRRPEAANSPPAWVQGVAVDSRPRMALGPGDQSAVSWSEAIDQDISVVHLLLRHTGSPDVRVRLSETGLDDRPEVAFTGQGRLLAVWEHSSATGADDPVTQLMATDLSFAWVDAQGAVQQRGFAVQAPGLDFGPALCRRDDGSVIVAWQHSDAASLIGTAADPVSIRATVFRSGTFEAPRTIADGLQGVLGWTLACDSAGDVLLAFARDLDGSLATSNDREIYFVRGNGVSFNAPQRLTNDNIPDELPQAALLADGTAIIHWSRGGALATVAGDLSQAPATWLPADQAPGTALGGAATATLGDRAYLVWPTPAGVRMISSQWRNGTLNPDPPATVNDSVGRRDLSLAADPFAGVLLGAFEETPAPDETWALNGKYAGERVAGP